MLPFFIRLRRNWKLVVASMALLATVGTIRVVTTNMQVNRIKVEGNELLDRTQSTVYFLQKSAELKDSADKAMEAGEKEKAKSMYNESLLEINNAERFISDFLRILDRTEKDIRTAGSYRMGFSDIIIKVEDSITETRNRYSGLKERISKEKEEIASILQNIN